MTNEALARAAQTIVECYINDDLTVAEKYSEKRNDTIFYYLIKIAQDAACYEATKKFTSSELKRLHDADKCL